MRSLRLAGAAVLWLLGVAAVAVVGCFAVDSTGRDVTAPAAMDAGLGAVPSSQPVTPAVTPTATPTIVTRRRTGPGGTVTASCAGTVIGDVPVRLANGWRKDVVRRPPSVVDLLLTGPGGRTVSVRATCRTGAPRFVVSGRRAEQSTRTKS